MCSKYLGRVEFHVCAKFKLCLSAASCLSPITTTFLTMERKYFPPNILAVFHLSQTASYGFDQNRAKFGPKLFVILEILNAMVRPIVDWLNQGNVNLFFLRIKLKRFIE